jgi:hypothetical protein
MTENTGKWCSKLTKAPTNKIKGKTDRSTNVVGTGGGLGKQMAEKMKGQID